jgi:hypothetical protein
VLPLSKKIQNILIAFIMAASVTVLFAQTTITFMKIEIFHIPVLLMIIFGLSLFIAEDVRNSFKKVLWFEKRKDKLPIWQVGIGMIFFFAQIGFVEVFARGLMHYNLGGMPLYVIFSFMNAFLLTVIYQEVFYEEQQEKTTELNQ